MANPLFKDDKNNYIFDIDESFKKNSLFYLAKEKLASLVIQARDNENDEFKHFLQAKNFSNFKNIIKFYTRHLKNLCYNENTEEVIQSIISSNLGKILILGYIEKTDYAFSSLSLSFENIKTKIFLDYTKDKDKININIEFLMASIELLNGALVPPEESIFLMSLNEIGKIFINGDKNNSSIVKTLKSLYENTLGIKVNISETFYLTISNRLLKEKELDIQKIKSSYTNLVKGGYIKKKVGNIFEIISDYFYTELDFIYLWLHNIIMIADEYSDNEIFIIKNIYEDYLEDKSSDNIKVFEKIDCKEIISKNVSDIFLEDYKIDIVKSFTKTGNINKKSITYKVKEIKEYKSISHYFAGKKGLNKQNILYNFCNNFFDLDNNIDNYHILLEPLSLASKKLINSNIYYGQKYDIHQSFISQWEKYGKQYSDKYIDIDDFIIDFFEKDLFTYIFFKNLRTEIISLIGRKIEEGQMSKYLLSENQLFKRFISYLGKVGLIDVFGQTHNKQITYLSGNTYGYNYGLSRSYVDINIFEPKFIKFKKLEINLDIPKDNHISGNDIYLSLDNDVKLFEEFSKFTKLEKMENYAVLNINRDVLIKAKNDYNISEKHILKIFTKINLTIPNNLSVLIKSTLNQKTDLDILPFGIPVILENIGIFNEFLKLKLFNKYILYSDENLRLIIFDEKFKSLEATLSKRKVLFSKK